MDLEGRGWFCAFLRFNGSCIIGSSLSAPVGSGADRRSADLKFLCHCMAGGRKLYDLANGSLPAFNSRRKWLGIQVQAKQNVAVSNNGLNRWSANRFRWIASWKMQRRSFPRRMMWSNAPRRIHAHFSWHEISFWRIMKHGNAPIHLRPSFPHRPPCPLVPSESVSFMPNLLCPSLSGSVWWRCCHIPVGFELQWFRPSYPKASCWWTIPTRYLRVCGRDPCLTGETVEKDPEGLPIGCRYRCLKRISNNDLRPYGMKSRPGPLPWI